MFFNQARARTFMQECGLDALVAASHLNITYFTGYFCWLDPTIRGYMLQPGAPASLALPGYAVFPLEGEPALVLNPLFAVNGADLWVRDLHVFGASGVDGTLTSDVLPDNYRRIHDLLLEPPRASSSLEALVRILEARGLTEGRLGVELEGLTTDRKEELAQALPGAALLDASNLIRLIRMVKNDYEIDLLTQSAAINEQAGMQILSEARPGTTLGEMNDRYRVLAAREGADFDHFCIGLGGLGMATEPDYALGEDDVMMVDFGCIYRRCFSDTGTTLALKELPDPLMRRFEAVRDCVAAGVDAMRPGVRCSAVRGAMWQVLEELGLTASYPHGHGVGLDVRDYPTVVADNGLRVSDDCIDVASDMPLEEDMVLNLEASMFLPGIGSLQMEHSLVVTADGCRNLVPQDRSRPFIPREGPCPVDGNKRVAEPLDPHTAGEIRKRSRTFFEEELDRYNDVSPPSIQDDDRTRRLLESLPVSSEAKLIDIGCGTGIVASHLRRLYPQADVCGIDISPRVTARAKELDRTGSIDFVVATESELPFADSVFDSAVCRFSLHHYPDLAAHFREVRRILKTGGIYLIVEVLPEAGPFQAMLNDVFAAAERESTGHVAYYSLEDYKELLPHAKLKLRSVRPFPLQLKMGKYLTHCREIRKTPASFRNRISFEEGNDWFSVRLPATGLFAEAE